MCKTNISEKRTHPNTWYFTLFKWNPKISLNLVKNWFCIQKSCHPFVSLNSHPFNLFDLNDDTRVKLLCISTSSFVMCYLFWVKIKFIKKFKRNFRKTNHLNAKPKSRNLIAVNEKKMFGKLFVISWGWFQSTETDLRDMLVCWRHRSVAEKQEGKIFAMKMKRKIFWGLNFFRIFLWNIKNFTALNASNSPTQCPAHFVD